MDNNFNSVAKAANGLSLANEVRLLRNGFSGASLLVEGAKDKLVYQKFIRVNEVKVLLGLCRENGTDAVEILNGASGYGILGLVDRDFETPNRQLGVEENIVYTEENDLEMMILCSPAFDAVLAEFGSPRKVDLVVERKRKSAREILFSASPVIGALRVMSKERDWNLRFMGMSYKFTDRREIEVDVGKQYEHARARTKVSPDWDLGEVKTAAEAIIFNARAVQDVCQGHDTVRIFGRAFRTVFGSIARFDSEQGAEQLEKILRLAYDERYFRSTTTYADMREWEMGNGFPLFFSNDAI